MKIKIYNSFMNFNDCELKNVDKCEKDNYLQNAVIMGK